MSREVWKALYFEGDRLEGRMLPAPPWIMRRGVIFWEGLEGIVLCCVSCCYSIVEMMNGS